LPQQDFPQIGELMGTQDTLSVINERTSVVLIAHGSRRAEANDDLLRLAEMVRARRPRDLVQVAYLELAGPAIPEAARACVSRGAQRVLLLPYFLSAGEHVTRDLERYRQQLAAEFPAVSFILCPPLGLHPLMIEIVLDRLQAAHEMNEEPRTK
jgi:sirohydrochlorin ferrochelatase